MAQTETTPMWNSKKGPVAPSAMATPYLDNCIAIVEGELAKDFDAAKKTILTALHAERLTR